MKDLHVSAVRVGDDRPQKHNEPRTFFLVVADPQADDDLGAIAQLAAELQTAIAQCNAVAGALRDDARDDRAAMAPSCDSRRGACEAAAPRHRCPSCVGVGFSVGTCADCSGSGWHTSLDAVLPSPATWPRTH